MLAAGGLVEAVCYLALHLNALLPFESPVSNSREILWFDEHKKIREYGFIFGFVQMFIVCLVCLQEYNNIC